MMFDMSSIQRGAPAAVPPIIIIHGPPGIGKTTFAAEAPNPIFLPTEESLTSLDVPRFGGEAGILRSYAEVMQALELLANQEHDFKTVVIDSLDWLETLVHEQVCAVNRWKSVEDPGYGKGFNVVSETIMSADTGIIPAIRFLRRRGMAIIMTAHTRIKEVKSAESDSYMKSVLKMHDKFAEKFIEASDLVLYASQPVNTTAAKAGDKTGAGPKRAVKTDRRILRAHPSPAYVSKTRFGSMPEEMDLSWASVAEHIPFYQNQKD